MTARKFYKTTIQVVVLSEEELAEMDLDELHYAITDGDCSGVVRTTSVKVLDGKQAARALRAQDSDPGFFRLTDQGEDEGDEDET